MPGYPTRVEFHIKGSEFSGQQLTDGNRKENYTPFSADELKKRFLAEQDPARKSYWDYCLDLAVHANGHAKSTGSGEELVMRWAANSVAKENKAGERVPGGKNSTLLWKQRVRFGGNGDKAAGKTYEIQYTERGQENFIVNRVDREDTVPGLLSFAVNLPVIGSLIAGLIPATMHGELSRVLLVQRERPSVVLTTYSSASDHSQSSGLNVEGITSEDPLAQHILKALLGALAMPHLARGKA